MKLRVIEKDGWFYPEYFEEGVTIPRWKNTFREKGEMKQLRFKSQNAAIEECKWFAENNTEGKVVWEAEL